MNAIDRALLLSAIDEDLIEEAFPAAWAPMLGRPRTSRPHVRRTFGRLSESGVAAAVISGIVAIGVLIAIILAGRTSPLVPPVGSDTESGITDTAEPGETNTPTESDTPAEPDRETDSAPAEPTEAPSEMPTEPPVAEPTAAPTEPPTEPVTEAPTEPETEPPLVVAEGLVFESNGDGTCKVMSLGTCKATRIIIPDTSPDGDLVTSIRGDVFHDKKALVEVVLPDAITYVPQFIGCYALERVVLPAACTELAPSIFDGCSKLCEVDFNGAAITAIPMNAFSSTALLSVSLPDSVTEIGDRSFSGAKKLTSVLYGAGMTKVGSRAFDGCKALRECRAASSEHSLDTLTQIGDSAFRSTALGEAAFSADLWVLGSDAFRGCPLPVVLDLRHTGISYLPETCFAYSKVQGVLLPETLTSIGNNCFEECTSLREVALPDSLTRLGSSVFLNCGKLESLYLGVSLRQISPGAFEGTAARIIWCENPTITEISYSAFSGYLGTSLTIPDSVSEIGAGVMAGCSKLTTICIPFIGPTAESTVYSTDCLGYLFGSEVDCWAQDKVIPASLKTVILTKPAPLGARNFMGVRLESIVLPAGTPSVNISAFEDVTTLKNVYFAGSAAAWSAVRNNSQEVAAATLWLYSETEPTDGTGRYWHYGTDGRITRW